MGDGWAPVQWDLIRAAEMLDALSDLLEVGHNVRLGDSRENVVADVRLTATTLRASLGNAAADTEAIKAWRDAFSGILLGEPSF